MFRLRKLVHGINAEKSGCRIRFYVRIPGFDISQHRMRISQFGSTKKILKLDGAILIDVSKPMAEITNHGFRILRIIFAKNLAVEIMRRVLQEEILFSPNQPCGIEHQVTILYLRVAETAQTVNGQGGQPMEG